VSKAGNSKKPNQTKTKPSCYLKNKVMDSEAIKVYCVKIPSFGKTEMPNCGELTSEKLKE
jgi:hypothetical protein